MQKSKSFEYEPASEPLHVCVKWLFSRGHLSAAINQNEAKRLASSPVASLEYLWEREFCIDNLLVRIHFIIVMIKKIGLAPWDFEFPFPGSLKSTFLGPSHTLLGGRPTHTLM